jgi:hypothetical protein
MPDFVRSQFKITCLNCGSDDMYFKRIGDRNKLDGFYVKCSNCLLLHSVEDYNESSTKCATNTGTKCTVER